MFEMPQKRSNSPSSSKRKPPPNYLSRREQMRLLVLVGSVMLVIILMIEAGKPENWQWWERLVAADPGTTEGETAGGNPDTRLKPQPTSKTELAPDVFVSPARPEETPDGAEDGAVSGYFPGVKPKLLEAVKDDMLLRPAEADAWYHLLAVLDKAEQDELERASTGRIGFVQLFEQAHEYRGRLVTIRGTVMRAYRLECPTNDYGIDRYWVCWLCPAGGPSSPIIIYSLDLPEGFPSGMSIQVEAEFTGFSYKRKVYQAKGESGAGETRTAPVVLAKTANWQPPAPEQERGWSNAVTIVLVVLGAALLGIGLSLFVYLRNRGVSDTTYAYSALGRARPEELASLADAELSPDVHERLGNMERRKTEDRRPKTEDRRRKTED